jgi:hypothetical protein
VSSEPVNRFSRSSIPIDLPAETCLEAKIDLHRSCVFVIIPLAADASRKNAWAYGELVSRRTFLESDPIGLAGGSYSTYAYANDNAIMRRDLSGLFSLGYAVSVSMADPQDMDPWYRRAAAALGFASVHGGLTQANHNRTRCTCTPQCNSWVLKECHETIILTVSIATGLGPSMEAQVRSDEQQHVDDMRAAAGQIYAAGASAENSQKALMYPDQTSCENSAANAVGAATLVPIQAAYDASWRRYDDSGLHTH